MITVDTVGIIISIFGLLGLVIVFLGFVSTRPTRREMKEEIKQSVDQLLAELQYIRARIDELSPRKRKV